MINGFIFQYGTWFAIFFRVLSVIVLCLFCIPLQIKEARVKNGLRLLRFQLLAFGIMLIFINVVTLLLLLSVVDTHQNLENIWLQIVNSLSNFGLALIGNRMYHTQYTDELKELHEQIARNEQE